MEGGREDVREGEKGGGQQRQERRRRRRQSGREGKMEKERQK